MLNKYIWVTLQKEILHQYNDAPKEVEYLKNLHRHILHIKVYVEVFTNDRDIEFIMFKHSIEKYLNKLGNNFNNNSCEQIVNYYTIILNVDIKIEN